jgi:hypothetical protein
VRQRLGAHAHLDARRQAGLAAVDGRHAQLGQPAAPGGVGQDHGLGHDQVERRAALALADAHLSRSPSAPRCRVAGELEAVVGAVEGFGLAAHLLALRLAVQGQAVCEGQLGGEGWWASAGASPRSQASVMTPSSWSWRRLAAMRTRSSRVSLPLSASVASSSVSTATPPGSRVLR